MVATNGRLKPAKIGGKKPAKKSAFGGVKKVSSSTFKETAAAAEREEKEIKVNFDKSDLKSRNKTLFDRNFRSSKKLKLAMRKYPLKLPLD